MHINRLKKIKSAVDNKAPVKYSHLETEKKKKVKILLPKYIEQQNENRILL